MCDERKIADFLEKECYTTPEAKDPTKPLMIKGEMVVPNPDYDPEIEHQESVRREIERREKHLGTSFFLNFDPLCYLHQLDSRDARCNGESVRRDMIRQLSERFIAVLVSQFPQNSNPPVNGFKKILRVAICSHGQAGFNNGEVYLWLPSIAFKEDFVFQMLKAFRDSLEEKPIVANVDGKDYPVQFYGWGFRYY